MEHHDGHDEDTRRVYDHMRQSNDAAKHQVGRMVKEIDEEHLVALGYLLGGITAGGGKNLASYFHGVVVAALESRFSICSACGVNHDEQLKQMTGSPEESKTSEGAPDARSLEEESGKFLEFFLGDKAPPQAAPESTEPPAQIPDLKIGETGLLSVSQQMNMLDYNLDDLRDEDTGVLLGFICLNCRMHYQTIEDRMLEVKGTAGCSGCIQKEKWG